MAIEGAPSKAAPQVTTPVSSASLWYISSGCLATATVLWAYWPTLVQMVSKWQNAPDYSHGFLVVPIALGFLWSRRSSFPAQALAISWWGLLALFIAVLFRVAAGRFYLLPLDGWTLPLTIGGAVWLLYGTSVIKWSWPSIVFLWFMVPIPFSAEHWLRVPLQAIATKLGTLTLVILGQPAIAEGNVIFLNDHTLFVEEACSGMRIFVGIFALAFAYILFSSWSYWQKALVLMATIPVAIIANVTRIVMTGLLYQYVSDEAGKKFSHDIAGLVMIPAAALLLWLFLIYLDRLFPRTLEVNLSSRLYQTSSVE